MDYFLGFASGLALGMVIAFGIANHTNEGVENYKENSKTIIISKEYAIQNDIGYYNVNCQLA